MNFQHTWTELPPDEKVEFRDRVIAAVQEIYPHYIIRSREPDNGDAFFVGNKQDDVRITVPLRDLYIRFALTGKTHDDLKETIFVEYAGMLNLCPTSEQRRCAVLSAFQSVVRHSCGGFGDRCVEICSAGSFMARARGDDSGSRVGFIDRLSRSARRQHVCTQHRR